MLDHGYRIHSFTMEIQIFLENPKRKSCIYIASPIEIFLSVYNPKAKHEKKVNQINLN